MVKNQENERGAKEEDENRLVQTQTGQKVKVEKLREITRHDQTSIGQGWRTNIHNLQMKNIIKHLNYKHCSCGFGADICRFVYDCGVACLCKMRFILFSWIFKHLATPSELNHQHPAACRLTGLKGLVHYREVSELFISYLTPK